MDGGGQDGTDNSARPPDPPTTNHYFAKDEINVPLALSAFRDKPTITVSLVVVVPS